MSPLLKILITPTLVSFAIQAIMSHDSGRLARDVGVVTAEYSCISFLLQSKTVTGFNNTGTSWPFCTWTFLCQSTRGEAACSRLPYQNSTQFSPYASWLLPVTEPVYSSRELGSLCLGLKGRNLLLCKPSCEHHQSLKSAK